MKLRKNKTAKVKKAPKAKAQVKSAPRKAVLKKKKPLAHWEPTLSLNNLKVPFGAHKKRKLLGRGSGSGHGKTSTRGSKGQTSRSGRDFYPGFEGGQTPLIRRIPKRGFTNIFKKEYQIINLQDLNRVQEPNITLELLEQKGLIRDKLRRVKILGDGEIKNKINIQAHAFSKNAADKIQKAGGKIEILNTANV